MYTGETKYETRENRVCHHAEPIRGWKRLEQVIELVPVGEEQMELTALFESWLFNGTLEKIINTQNYCKYFFG